MKNLRQIVVIVAAVLLLAGVVIAWLLRSAEPVPSVAVPLARSIEPATPQPPAGQARPVQANAGQPGAVQGGADGGEATPEFVTEPVTEPDVDEKAVTPSAETINAVREIRKPADGEGQVTKHPDGSASVNLGNRYLSVPVATVGKDGKVNVEYHGEKYVQPEAQQPEVQQSEVQQPEAQQPEVQKNETHQP